ncbi:hypothetical protein NN561_016767 [Cricetulus griseus]
MIGHCARAPHWVSFTAGHRVRSCRETLRYVNIAIPCNNKGAHSVGLMWWTLAPEVFRMRGAISGERLWDVIPGLYPEKTEEEQAAAKKAATKEEFHSE